MRDVPVEAIAGAVLLASADVEDDVTLVVDEGLGAGGRAASGVRRRLSCK